MKGKVCGDTSPTREIWVVGLGGEMSVNLLGQNTHRIMLLLQMPPEGVTFCSSTLFSVWFVTVLGGLQFIAQHGVLGQGGGH